MKPARSLGQLPGLLVSVRSAAEAIAALTGGADVIDVKEPDRGPLGAADPQTIADIVRVVAGRVPVTTAAGELLDIGEWSAMRTIESLPSGVLLCKIGLRGCHNRLGWESLWNQAAAYLREQAHRARLVAVVYADWQTARAPKPSHILQVATDLSFPALLVDTWDKSAGNLFDHWSMKELSEFMAQVHAGRMAIVLAGSLSGANIAEAARLAPDLVAVRGAACDNGRGGTVAAERVAALKQMITIAGSQWSTATSASS